MRLIGLAVVLTFSLLAAPLAADAQQTGNVHRVAVLGLLPNQFALPFLNALREGLRDLGYVDRRNLVLDYLTADAKPERLPEVAADAVRLGYDVIVTTTNEVTAAGKRATSTVPIVMVVTADPVGAGLIASLARPGGNLTGLTTDAAPEVYAKPIEFIKEILPRVAQIAVLRRPGTGWDQVWSAASDVARKLSINLRPFDIRTAADIETAFRTLKAERVRAFMFWPGSVTYPFRKQVADLALKDGLVSASFIRQFPDAGGLLSYGPHAFDLFRRAAVHVDKILKGAKPADLPVEQPTKFELVINLKTAKALGLTIPPTLLLRADQVIE
jgi:putative tryptophan/tyrosine transport system substrate-binding protein